MIKFLSQRKRKALAALLCACVFVLTACEQTGVPVKEQASITLPPATVSEAAPIGDAALEYTKDFSLYLPKYDGLHLTSFTASVPCSAARLDAESVTRALLGSEGNGIASPIGGSTPLALYGSNPVEISGNVATVNLAASALQLDRKALYLCAQAITNTLTETGNVRYVNILVMDRQLGLDLASTLPEGLLTKSVGGDVGAAYEQLLSQRVSADEDPTQQRLSATVTLYFPLSAVDGVMAEARNIAFTSQAPEDMVTRILQELSEGPVRVEGSPTLPLLEGLLSQPPEITEPADGSGKLISLSFDSSLDDMLQTKGVSRASCMAALCYTLCTFLPNVTGLAVSIGGEKVDHVMLGSSSGVVFDGGVQKRADYAALLMDAGTLYFADSTGKSLVAVRRPMPYYQSASPRSLLLELFRGPNAADSRHDVQAVVPTGLLSDADILGLSFGGATLAVNLSATFRKAGAGMTAAQDRLLVYSLVNTLLYHQNAARVCFFVGGKNPEDFSGEIYWAGYFYKNTGFVS